MMVADRKGFEPSRQLPAYSLSRGAPSTARPPVHLQVYMLERFHSRRFFKNLIYKGNYCFMCFIEKKKW